MLTQSAPMARHPSVSRPTAAAPNFMRLGEPARIRLWFTAALLAADFLHMSLGPSMSRVGTPWWLHEYKALSNATLHAFVWWASMYMADAVSPKRLSPRVAYTLACLLATAASLAIWLNFYSLLSMKADFPTNQLLNWIWQITLMALWKFALATSAYVYFQHGQSGRSALQRLRLERAQVMRQSTATQLRAMQARINPQFLIATLEDVERRCEAEPDAADHILACLIAYLRASTPIAVESSCTIAAEMALVQTYLDVVAARNPSRFTYDIALARDTGNAQLPAMLLLPLVEHAALAALRAPGTATLSFRVDLNVARHRLVATALFTDIEPECETDTAVLDIGKRLEELFGKAASLAKADAPAGTSKLVMEIPDERTERSDR